jgi:hypothetical protein
MKRTDEKLTDGQRAGLYPMFFLTLLIGMAVGLYLPQSASGQEKQQEKSSEFCAKCAGLKTAGTTVHFTDTVKEAQKYAKEHGKLVFMLHVSGNFDKEEFT